MDSENTPRPVSLSRLGQIGVAVADLEAMTTFYRDVLGLPFLFAAPGMSFFDCGGVRLMLDIAEQPEFRHPPSILYYKVGDIGGTHRALEAGGVETVEVPHLIAQMPDGQLVRGRESDHEHRGLNALAVYALLQSSRAIPDERLAVNGEFLNACIENLKAGSLELTHFVDRSVA